MGAFLASNEFSICFFESCEYIDKDRLDLNLVIWLHCDLLHNRSMMVPESGYYLAGSGHTERVIESDL